MKQFCISVQIGSHKKSITFFTILLTVVLLNHANGQSKKDASPGPPELPGMAATHKPATKVNGQWTLLSDKDDLKFEAKSGACDGRDVLIMKVQNRSKNEVHVFVSLALQDGPSAPQQVLILKANQTVELGCRSKTPFMTLPLRAGQQALVKLDYKINKRL